MPTAPKSPNALKRTGAGRYESGDDRFVVEQSSGRWMVIDAEATDDLGLPLVRGPFGTLDDARAAIETARSGPAPTSGLADRIAARPRTQKPRARKASRSAPTAHVARATRVKPPPRPAKPELRDFRAADGDELRALWQSVGFRSLGDDDPSLARFAARNPGLLIVATSGDAIVGSALGGWDGRRGWIYHVATAPEHRRAGLGTRLVRRVEGRLRDLGCPKVNVIVRDASDEGLPFWEGLGYRVNPAKQLGREL